MVDSFVGCMSIRWSSNTTQQTRLQGAHMFIAYTLVKSRDHCSWKATVRFVNSACLQPLQARYAAQITVPHARNRQTLHELAVGSVPVPEHHGVRDKSSQDLGG